MEATFFAIFAALLLVVLVASTPIFFAARKSLKLGRGAAIGIAAILGPTSVGALLWAGNECSVSSYLTSNLKKNLSPKEFVSLRTDGLVCPTSGIFQRDKDGKRVGVFVLDELFHSSVRVIDDSHGP